MDIDSAVIPSLKKTPGIDKSTPETKDTMASMETMDNNVKPTVVDESTSKTNNTLTNTREPQLPTTELATKNDQSSLQTHVIAVLSKLEKSTSMPTTDNDQSSVNPLSKTTSGINQSTHETKNTLTSMELRWLN